MNIKIGEGQWPEGEGGKVDLDFRFKKQKKKKDKKKGTIRFQIPYPVVVFSCVYQRFLLFDVFL